MDVKQVLIEARRLIAEKGWTQGTWARDENNVRCDTIDKAAVCFCGLGAIRAAANHPAADPIRDKIFIWQAEEFLNEASKVSDYVKFNDTPGRTREEVLAVFDRAIGELK
ncbi:MAG TPA: hypothetical protein VFZ38_10645 [Vicinamibacterales bacterium]